MSDDAELWSNNGWRGYVRPYNGTPMGLFSLRCQKGARVIYVEKLDMHEIETFDPDAYWKNQDSYRNTRNMRLLKENK